MIRVLSFVLTIFGAVAFAIGAAIWLVGPHQVAGFISSLSNALLGVQTYTGGLDAVNIDSEMRFFSVFWAAYGVMLMICARDPERYRGQLIALLGLFLLGGLGRLLSAMDYGQPDVLFVALGWIELTLPVLLGGALLAMTRLRS